MSQKVLDKGMGRAIVLIVDGCGIGAAPDASAFGDRPDCNSLGNTAKAVGGLRLPNLARLGLGNIAPIEGVAASSSPQGVYGCLQEKSNGKDTQTGHWEMMGIVSSTPFRMYPDGFPQDVVEQFIAKTGCKEILCNKPASGTVVLDEFGPTHQRTGYPIVYTSGDSVLQIACHVETVPLATLYSWCEIARHIMQGPHLIGRIIARPFTSEPGNYRRLSFERRDYGMKPPKPTFLDNFIDAGAGVLGIGKIEDIFDKQGITHAVHTGSNKQGLELTAQAVRRQFDLAAHAIGATDAVGGLAPDAVRFIFTNLVDTDALFGHRRNVEGYAGALEEIDTGVAEIIEAMNQEDVLIITSDHGNDPTAPGTDHTREYVPLLAYAKSFAGRSGLLHEAGIRDGFYDLSASLSAWFGLPWQGPGTSFLPQLASVAS